MSDDDDDLDDFAVWIEKLRAGDEDAASEIWREYFRRLVGLASSMLKDLPRRESDEEDIALSAMNSFYRGVSAGRFPHLDAPDDLWRLLVTIVFRKVASARKRRRAKKRGQGLVRGDSAFVNRDDGEGAGGIDQVLDEGPTPAMAAMMVETCRLLLDALDDDTLRLVALFKLEGLTNEEIGAKLDCVPRTVERKLNRIRNKWQKREEEEVQQAKEDELQQANNNSPKAKGKAPEAKGKGPQARRNSPQPKRKTRPAGSKSAVKRKD